MTTENESLEWRGFYFFFSHNESPYVPESYSFKAEVTFKEGGERRKYDPASHTFWYRRLPRPGREASPHFLPMQGGLLPSEELPALIVFADRLPRGLEATATVAASDQYQWQDPAEIGQFSGGIVHFWNRETLGSLPLLPDAPRIFVKPLTYEYYTTGSQPFAARFRLVVEDWVGGTPRVAVNGRPVSLGSPLPADALPAPFLWDVQRASVPIDPARDMAIAIECRNRLGRSVQAGYRFREMDRLGAWGYELDGPDPVRYSALPGGRTPIAAYAGLFARCEGVPVVTKGPEPNVGKLRLRIGDREHDLGCTCRVTGGPAPVLYRDESGRDVPGCYGWTVDWQSEVFALVACRERLPRTAEERRIFAAWPGERVEVAPKGVPTSELPTAFLGIAPAAIAGSAVELVSGSLEKWVRVIPRELESL